MSQGWITLNREITEHWLWKKDKFSKGQAWIDLLLHANHAENKALIKGQVIIVQRGQQIRSQITLAKRWKWDRKTVKRFLELLQSQSMIVLKGTHATSVISICNYNQYQDVNNNSPHLKGQVSPHAVPITRDTNNNNNNINNETSKENPLVEHDEKPIKKARRIDPNKAEHKRISVNVIDFLNEKAQKNFQPVEANLNMIQARLKEGFTERQLKQVTAMKIREWKEDPAMTKYIRPATLYSKTNFANYSGELIDE